MRRGSLPSTARLAAGAFAASLALAAAVLATAGLDGTRTTHAVDTGLCRFPLDVTVTSTGRGDGKAATALRFTFEGPRTITLKNALTGRKTVLNSTGPTRVDRAGSVGFSGHQVWLWSTGKSVPFLTTDGTGSLFAPEFVLRRGTTRARVVDPCALVGPSKPSTQPRTTRAPWGLPAYELSQMGYAGITPLLGSIIRHDHSHLDLIVNGKRVGIPAGVGLAEPQDTGPCPNGPQPQGDCTTRHIYVAQVANSPLHTHSASGLIHIEADRRTATYTLGQFFDQWGVRLTSSCVGGYCSGGGSELRVYLDGKRVSSDPRKIVLTNHQEIAVVFGGPRAFASVPKSYKGGWPGIGCGGPGEPSCYP